MLDSWPRVVEMFARAGLQAERAVFDANLLVLGPLALDLWRDLVLEGARVTDATTTELRHSAVQLLGELDNEKAPASEPSSSATVSRPGQNASAPTDKQSSASETNSGDAPTRSTELVCRRNTRPSVSSASWPRYASGPRPPQSMRRPASRRP